MPVILKNNAVGYLANAIAAVDTSIALTTGSGAAFPALSAGQYFYATIADTAGVYEVIKVTARTTDTLTAVRAQEGTTAAAFGSGSRVEARVTAQSVVDAITDRVTATAVLPSYATNALKYLRVNSGATAVEWATVAAGTGDVVGPASATDNALARFDLATGKLIQNSTATLSDAGLLTATSFSGTGTALTALNASNLGSGTVPDARFPATLPAVSGANLTSLNATNLASGTVADGRLSANVALKNASSNFTAGLQVSGVEVGFRTVPVSSNATGTLVAGDVGKQLVTSANQTLPTAVFSPGDVVVITNNSAASITLTTSAVTAYLCGVNTTRTSITIATRGQATINCVAAGTFFISGAGVS